MREVNLSLEETEALLYGPNVTLANWTLPIRPDANICFENLGRRAKFEPVQYLDHVDLNCLGVTAYSSFGSYSLTNIVAHYGDSGDYGGNDEDKPYWAHFPMRQGETVIEIWRRDYLQYPAAILAVRLPFFSTTKSLLHP